MYQHKIIENIDHLINQLDRRNKTIVFTNGCFDLLHKGHVHLLQEAKNTGDILIVAINSDTSVKKLKGETRPIESLEKRIKKVADLPFVDFVISF
ncbi:MAG TPA: adenylyltransferase/cytidyltransferase family protein, partial [Chitinophagales bacterium]|nr:adenylyltransferase/cytidyltransferase family protein [Chitinophagales bacterium]